MLILVGFEKKTTHCSRKVIISAIRIDYSCLSVCTCVCIQTDMCMYISIKDFIWESSEEQLWSSLENLFSGSFAVSLYKVLNTAVNQFVQFEGTDNLLS